MLAWGNINLFDFRSQLVHNRVSIAMLPPPRGFEALLNPLGATGQLTGVCECCFFIMTLCCVCGEEVLQNDDDYHFFPPPIFLPTGQTLANDTTCLEVEFERRFNQQVTFPDTQQMEDYARYIIKLERKPKDQVNIIFCCLGEEWIL